MKDQVTVAIVGYGPRGEYVFARFTESCSFAKLVAVAEPVEQRRERAAKRFDIPENMLFKSAEEFFAQEKMCDAVIIATSDGTHVKYSLMAAEKGYHILVEKPLTDNVKECKDLAEKIKQTGVITSVCHELRYGSEYASLKKCIEEGKIGEIVHITQVEPVGYWHQAHSFVRGIWRKKEDSSPMILAKCCHDTDMMLWLTEKMPKHVSSYGCLSYFKEENAPEGSTEYCMKGCKVKEDCPYDCEKYYLRNGIPSDAPDYVKNSPNLKFVITKDEPTDENIRKALLETNYGKCVFRAGNDVVDHQVVNISFEGGATGQLLMLAFTAGGEGRYTHIYGTLGELILENGYIRERIFGKSDVIRDFTETEDLELYGHDSCDKHLIEEFYRTILARKNGENAVLSSSIEMSVMGHVVAILAEKSRLEDGKSLDVQEEIEKA